ncbi:MAG TPA: hypothetical protein VIX58_10220, partial [Anaerolineae bacterium]
RRVALWLALYIAIPTLSVFLLNLYRPLFLERYLNGVAPAYYLLLALGLAALFQGAFSFRNSLFPHANSESNSRLSIASSPWRPLAFVGTWLLVVAAAVLALTNYFFNPVYSKAPDWRLLATYVRESVRSGDVVLQNFPEMSLLYYLGNSVPIQVLPVEFLPDARTEGQLAALARKYARVWFIPAAPDFWDPDHFVEQWLDSHSDMYQENAAGILRIRLYATAQEFLPARTPVQVHVDGFADLVGYRLARQAGRTRLVLYWKSTASTGMNYTVFAHALTRDEVLIAGVDNEPVHGTRPTSSWRPGEVVVDQYLLNADESAMLLEVGMYDRETNLRVPLSGADGTRSNQDRFMIQTSR